MREPEFTEQDYQREQRERDLGQSLAERKELEEERNYTPHDVDGCEDSACMACNYQQLADGVL